MQGTLLGSSARGTQAELFVPQICLSLRVCREELSRSARQNGLLASGGTPLSLPMEECPEVQKLLQLLKQLNPSLRPCPGHSVLARDSLFISCLGDHQAVASDSAPPVSGGPPPPPSGLGVQCRLLCLLARERLAWVMALPRGLTPHVTRGTLQSWKLCVESWFWGWRPGRP